MTRNQRLGDLQLGDEKVTLFESPGWFVIPSLKLTGDTAPENRLPPPKKKGLSSNFSGANMFSF